ncbi:DUF421 domain-containing protein [Paenibacillus physcomitrellae]|nr:YetF domain-containing protein [Paenibacillus physcomitrellae]
MTIPQVAILLMVGTVLGSGISGKLGNALVSGAILLGILVLVEWITLKWNGGEKVFKGGSVVVIQNGRLVQSHLKKLRITVDDLEKRMRAAGISRIESVQFGTIENNGLFGYELMPEAKPVTMGDLERLLKQNFPQLNLSAPASQAPTLFSELEGGHNEDIPSRLH